MPAFAAGLLSPNNTSGGGLLEPTQILTPNIVNRREDINSKHNEHYNISHNVNVGDCIDQEKASTQGISVNNRNSITAEELEQTVDVPTSLTNEVIAQTNSKTISNSANLDVSEGLNQRLAPSSDIFNQIGNLVKSNEMCKNEQLPKHPSGLGNETKLAKSPPSKMADKYKQSLTRTEEVSNVVSAFPLLDFMRSPVLMFPTKSDDVRNNSTWTHSNERIPNYSPSHAKDSRDTNSIFMMAALGADDRFSTNMLDSDKNDNEHAIHTLNN